MINYRFLQLMKIIRVIRTISTIEIVMINSCSPNLNYGEEIDLSPYKESMKHVDLKSLPIEIKESRTVPALYIGKRSNYINKQSKIIYATPSSEGFLFEYQKKKIVCFDNFLKKNDSETKFVVSIKKSLTQSEVEGIIDELKKHNINIEYITIPEIKN